VNVHIRIQNEFVRPYCFRKSVGRLALVESIDVYLARFRDAWALILVMDIYGSFCASSLQTTKTSFDKYTSIIFA
jgi:hypothetical protein